MVLSIDAETTTTSHAGGFRHVSFFLISRVHGMGAIRSCVGDVGGVPIPTGRGDAAGAVRIGNGGAVPVPFTPLASRHGDMVRD